MEALRRLVSATSFSETPFEMRSSADGRGANGLRPVRPSYWKPVKATTADQLAMALA